MRYPRLSEDFKRIRKIFSFLVSQDILIHIYEKIACKTLTHSIVAIRSIGRVRGMGSILVGVVLVTVCIGWAYVSVDDCLEKMKVCLPPRKLTGALFCFKLG